MQAFKQFCLQSLATAAPQAPLQGWRRREERHRVYWVVSCHKQTRQGGLPPWIHCWEQRQSPEAGAATPVGATHISSCCLLSTYCVLGSELAMGWWEAGRQTTGP